jgi:outer membrane protein
MSRKNVGLTWLSAGLLLGGSLFAAPALAEIRVGFVHVSKVLDQAPQKEQANQKLEKEFAPRNDKIVEQQKELVKLEEELVRDAEIMSADRRRNAELEVVRLKRDIKRMREEFNEDFSLRRNEELRKLQRAVAQAIDKVANDEKYDLVVSEGVLFASKRVDISVKVLDLLKSEADK